MNENEKILTELSNLYVKAATMYYDLKEEKPKAGDLDAVISYETALEEFFTKKKEFYNFLGSFSPRSKSCNFRQIIKNIEEEIQDIELRMSKCSCSRDILSYRESLAIEKARLDVYKTVKKLTEDTSL